MAKTTKTTKTYSINKKTYEMFDRVCKNNNINKSSFIESMIKDYLSENLDYDYEELYQSKMDEDYAVSIIGSDDTFFDLSDGSRISKIMFYHNFEGCELIDPEEFFDQSPAEKIVESVRKMTPNDDGEFEIEIGIPSIGKEILKEIYRSKLKMNGKNVDEMKSVEDIPKNLDDILSDKNYLGSSKKDMKKIKTLKSINKYRGELWNIIRKSTSDEDIFYGLRNLSEKLKNDISLDEKSILHRDIKFLINVGHLLNEEILFKLKKYGYYPKEKLKED